MTTFYVAQFPKLLISPPPPEMILCPIKDSCPQVWFFTMSNVEKKKRIICTDHLHLLFFLYKKIILQIGGLLSLSPPIKFWKKVRIQQIFLGSFKFLRVVYLCKTRWKGWYMQKIHVLYQKRTKYILLSVNYLVRWHDRAFWRKSNLTGMAP